MAVEVDDTNFEKEVLEKSKEIAVLVDFYADWCPPCAVLKPILEKIAEKDRRFVLVKVNVDKAPKVSNKYGVMSIPYVKLFRNREVVGEFVGAMPEEMVSEWLDKNLQNG